MSRLRNRGLAAATASAVVAVIVWGLPAAGNQQTAPAGTTVRASAMIAGKPITVTLVTGDKVIATRGPGGTFSTDVLAGPGRAGMAFHKVALGNQLSIVPMDAVPLIAAGVVDARLFDVALLADLGLDDESAPRLPLLVQYDGQARAVRSALPEGTEVKRDLPSIDAIAIGQERTQATDLWWSWTNSPQAKRRTGLAGTVKKVWLDSGRLIARGNGPSTVGGEVARYEQRVELLDRSGRSVVDDEKTVGAAYLLDIDRQQLYLVSAGDTIRLPRGRYLVDAFEAKSTPGGQGFGDVTYFGEPDLIVDHAGSIVLDGRNAHRIAIKPPVTDAAAAIGGVGFARPIGNLTYVGGVGINNSFEPGFSPALYVVPNRTGSAKDFTGFAQLAWAGMPDGQSPDGNFYLDSPYLYHDVAVWPGRFPTKPSLITKPGDYAHLDASYAGEPGTRANNYGYPSLPEQDAGGHWIGVFLFTPAVEMNLPFHRDEYYSAKGVSWAFETEVFRQLPNQEIEYTALVDSQHVAYPAGRSTPIRWQQGVPGPSLPDARGGIPGRDQQPWTFRSGNSLTVVVPMYADGGAGRFGAALVDSEQTTVLRNGVEIGASDSPGQQTFALPADDSAYVLTKDVKRSAERYKLATEISSEWTFRSRRTPEGVSTPLPLMNVRYSPVLDDRNRAAAGRFEVPFSVEHQYGTPDRPVVSAIVEASFDGKTWRRLPVRRTGSGWVATIDQPGSGFVSLRTTAKDAGGNQVRQTTLRAYELK